MTKVSLEPCKGGFADKIKALSKADGDVAEVGWFAEQGDHETADMTYAELAKYHASGQDGVTPRPMLHIALEQFAMRQPRATGRVIGNYLENPSQANLDKIIETLGREYWEMVRSTLGDPVLLQPVTTNPTPLVLTGDLKKHTAYRTNKNRTLRTK